MNPIKRYGLIAGLLMAPVVQAAEPSDTTSPFQALYQAAQANPVEKQAAGLPLHAPVSQVSVPSPVQSVIYGVRLPNGEYVTYCRIEHTHALTQTLIGGPGRSPREQR